MNKIVIPIIIGIIAIISISLSSLQESEVMEVEDTLNKELMPIKEDIPEIQEKLEDIEKNVEEFNKEGNSEYDPSRTREWITSGPFQIDRSEYVLGEKIFLRIGGLEFNEKGQAVFLMPSNGTHYTVYLSIPFDGKDKPAFNYYLEPDLSAAKNICTLDEIVGDWKVVFRGTDYPDLEFRITEQILPGDEEDYEPVC